MAESSTLSPTRLGESSWSRPFSLLFQLTRLSSSLLLYVLISTAIQGVYSSQHVLSPPPDTCVSQDSPNEHAQQYPSLVSGNLNATTLIIPIPLVTARQVIPKEYNIIEQAYRALLPSFPKGMYPMMAQIVHDHDIQVPAYNASIPDFSRASLEFPFLDIFGNGHSSFRWAGTFLISASNAAAIGGSKGYGITVHPASFDPPCDAYRELPGDEGATYAGGWSSNGTDFSFMTVEARPSTGHVPYSLDFLSNVSNQPVFANTRHCDYFVRMFNTTLTSSATPVVAKVNAKLEPFTQPQTWDGVYGWRLSTPFLEPTAPQECKPEQ